MSETIGKPHHDFGRCIACAACAVACDTRAIRIFVDEDEGLLVWTLDLTDCTWCGRCAQAPPGTPFVEVFAAGRREIILSRR